MGQNNFLTGLASQLTDQFSLSDNQNRSLDIANDGTAQRNGKAGDLAKKFDNSTERKYVQEGYLRTDYNNVSPKAFEVLFQEPDITVLVKKRAFCALAENFDPSHMDADEKLFYKATKVLFSNKCQQIAAFEALSKIYRVSTETGSIATQLIPLIVSLSDELSSSLSDFKTSTPNTVATGTDPTGGGLSKLQSAITQIKNVFAFSKSNHYTSWIADTSNIFKSKFGQGTGVLEFCNVSGLQASTTNSEGSTGTFSLNIQDPYKMMRISNFDIEKALNDATNAVYNNKFMQFGQDSVDSIVSANTNRLNQIRNDRGAGPIEFITNPDSSLSPQNQIVAIISDIGEQINFTYNSRFGLGSLAGGGTVVSPESLLGSSSVGEQGLDPNKEVPLFNQVIEALYNGIQMRLNSQSIAQMNSSTTNYARRKLRLHYLGKLLIQPQDQIHIYIGSKSRLDNKILSGLPGMFSGLGFLQKINNTASGFRDSFDALFNPNGNANFQLEKTLLVGHDFPNWLWTLLGSMFTQETSGAHVFGGVVVDTQSDFNASSGGYSVNVSGEDMTHYLKQGRVNFKPSVSVFNGPLYDPLTPFKTSIDNITDVKKNNAFDLLDENKQLLQANIVKYKNGPLIGRPATEKNINQQDSEISNIGQVRQVFYPPDGLVYKWKEGIGTLTQFSSSYSYEGDATVGYPAITQNPFAGQDIMNIISLSITGQPYNYATFYKGAQLNGIGKDPQTGESSAQSFYSSLTRDLVKNNLLWGNFIPFKNLVMSEATFQKIITAQFRVQQLNSSIDDQLKQIKDLKSKIQLLSGAVSYGISPDSNTAVLLPKLQKAILDLNQSNNNAVQQLNGNNGLQGLDIIGNDVSYDPDSFLSTNINNNSSLSQPSQRRDLRRKINFLTRRLSWQVRANEDKNLFIVDDTYDKDYDLQAFEQALQNPELFESQFDSVLGNVRTAASFLNLEVFCDSQGHIRVRSPLYNRMPSSVFYRMFQLKQQNGIQIYPQFLETLFVNQLQSIQNNLEIIEDQIRLACAVLGKATDNDCLAVVNGFLSPQPYNSLGGIGNFNFITDQNSGTILNFNSLYTEANPKEKLELINNSIEGQLKTQAGIQDLFNSVQRAGFVLQSFDSITGSNNIESIAQGRVNKLTQRLTIKTGQQVTIDQYESSNPTIAQKTPGAMVPDIFKISNDIADYLSQRQKLVKQLYKAITNAKEAISLDSTNGKQTANSLLMSNFSQNSQIPELFEEMIEDETYDDLGPGSGRRYVIEEYQIKSLTIREAKPEHTMVEVKGLLSYNLPAGDLPQDLNTFGSGGNALVSAAAVDYDLWRMYGFINTSSVSAPFLSDPQSQCAPYAATILSRARKNILQGSVTIAGNEYSQVGDTIYISSEDLLFYVTSVSHNFNYGSSFTTTLELKYGHCPGDYIPTTLDVIGKLLYNNRSDSNYINYRQDQGTPQQNLGVIIVDRRSTSPENQLLGGTYGAQNITVLNNILYSTALAIQSNNDPKTTVQANLELRVFYNSASGSADSVLTTAAQSVKQMLSGTYNYSAQSPLKIQNQSLPANNIQIPNVDVSGKSEMRSPSQKALDMVRNINGTSSTANGATNISDGISQVLYGYIIDVWITFENTANPSANG